MDATNMVTAVTTYTRVILLTLSWVAALITPHTAAAFSFTDTVQQVSLAQVLPNLTAHAQTLLLMSAASQVQLPAGEAHCMRKCSKGPSVSL